MNETQDNNSKEKMEKYFFRASAEDFRVIPGSPIAYWASDSIRKTFRDFLKFEDVAPTRKGMVTARNEVYVRSWHEVSLEKNGLDKYPDRESAKVSGKKWFSYLKGGGYRKWYGNKFDIVNWENDGKALQTTRHPSEDRVWATNFNLVYIFKKNINWGAITSSEFSARYSTGGELFDAGGSACFPTEISYESTLGFLNAKISGSMLKTLNPTLNFQAGNIANLPFLISTDTEEVKSVVNTLISSYKKDWDSYETSWDFKILPLLQPEHHQPSLEASYHSLRTHWREMTSEMQRLEEENNRIFIDAYGLQDELTPEVPLREITLTCNPHYRYGGEKTEEELEALLLADTMRELVSYAVGCMFGRYSLDKESLILANQGETLDDYLAQVPQPSFPADKDNVIPILDDDWFADDISERFRQFLRVAFGEEHYEDNLAFIEQALNIKNKRYYSLRDYFLSEFYNDHVKRYKKRPIYWLFSSPKGSFNALIYMHRYRTDTVSVVLNDYLREFRTKLASHKSHLEAVSISANSTPSDKTKALKEIEKLNKILVELEEYERDVMYPLATKQLAIDLDDGVKANYPKFGTALKKIVGL